MCSSTGCCNFGRHSLPSINFYFVKRNTQLTCAGLIKKQERVITSFSELFRRWWDGQKKKIPGNEVFMAEAELFEAGLVLITG